ncbi:MAG TPA: glutamate--tRNA ligase, partial [Thermoleophilaceae bacterium]|nr:glutamate--tRNA ligase [Thermoleophilaceae bacterium]
ELDCDEGPFSQWARRDRHAEAVERLLADGHAYEDEGAVRLRVPDDGETVIHDVIRGDITFPHAGIADFVIQRSDGSPLYNLAVAVDDLDMGITDVVRGDDHISNTPRQVMILRALGEEPPRYAHLPLLHGPDGKKLSKRHGAASVQDLRDAGYLPEAVRNYIALLGWGYDESTTFFTTDELVERFDLTRVSKNPAVFDEQKLRWMNGRYLRALDPEDLRRRLEELSGREVPPEAVAISQEKMQTLADFWPLAGFLVERGPFDERAWARVMRDGAPDRLRAAREALEAAGDPFDVERVEAALRGVVDRLGVKPKEVFQPVRVAITGTTVSPGIFESVAALGREETLARIDDALRRAAG